MKLEYVDTLVLAHPYVKGFDRTSYCLDEVEQRAVSIGEVPPAVAARTEADLVEGQGGTVWTTTFYIGLMIERKPRAYSALSLLALRAGQRGLAGLLTASLGLPTAGANGPRKLDISYPTNEFTKLVKMWDKYEPETMGVIVRYIKRYVVVALPSALRLGRYCAAPLLDLTLPLFSTALRCLPTYMKARSQKRPRLLASSVPRPRCESSPFRPRRAASPLSKRRVDSFSSLAHRQTVR
jgi:hypothetical protein